MACIFADANGPRELWENVLAQRRAFRRIPAQRLPGAEYVSQDPAAHDLSYCGRAAVIEGYSFDRVGYRISGDVYRSTDPVHWLALDVAGRALSDANFPNAEGLPKESTGVLVGNTLTGEFSRAQLMRLRWPFVRRMVEEQLAHSGLLGAQRADFLAALEVRYKLPFAPSGEESLAGGLSNTIAGRICNQYDLGGGGYAVDGACSSSLLAVANACRGLAAHEIDVALVGGVDVSLDPFELVGFCRLEALARDEMRIYDERPSGFLPGEGCGFAVLMRERDALAMRRSIYAVIRGWGVSSDGAGGLTRPEVAGQVRALDRAYRLAGYAPDSVALFEGHGTGTAVGDPVELAALIQARNRTKLRIDAAAIGSVKANIGHTKAAAGVAGLIKAALAIQAQVRPPTTGVDRPHALLHDAANGLRILRHAEVWPQGAPMRASVSSFGFGGINVHLAMEGSDSPRRHALTARERQLSSSTQDIELLLLSAQSTESMQHTAGQLASIALTLADAELADLAAELAGTAAHGSVRAAVVAATPVELHQRLQVLIGWLAQGVARRFDAAQGVFLSCGLAAPKIVFMFPGQGSPARMNGGAMERRFAKVSDLYACAALVAPGDMATTPFLPTDIAQPAVLAAQLAALRILDDCGVRAHAAVGHSLGELGALCWAGALGDVDMIRLARLRGVAMAGVPGPPGAMATIGASSDATLRLLAQMDSVSIAALNSPAQTVITGELSAVLRVIERAQAAGLRAMRLPVSHAFHSPLMRPACDELGEHLQVLAAARLSGEVYSTVSAEKLRPDQDLPALLLQQLTEPVLFSRALAAAVREADLLIEVGPGNILTALAATMCSVPAVAIDAAGPSLRGLFSAIGAAFAAGSAGKASLLFTDRFTKPFAVDRERVFFENPCAGNPSLTHEAASPPPRPARMPAAEEPGKAKLVAQASVLDVLREVVARRAEIPVDLVNADTRLLADLHLNSITVGQLVADTARKFGLAALVAPTEYAQATLKQIAQAIQTLLQTGSRQPAAVQLPAGSDTWVRAFRIEWLPCPARLERERATAPERGVWQVFAPAQDTVWVREARRILAEHDESGTAVILPRGTSLREVGVLMLDAAQAFLRSAARIFLVVQHGGGAASFARTLYLENRDRIVCVVDLQDAQACDARVLAELAQASGYHEVRYDCDGARQQPFVQHVPVRSAAHTLRFTSRDVILVSGGGKGIAALCAAALAERTGACLLLLGRSDPDADAELRGNLQSLRARSIPFEYCRVDIAARSAVRAVLADVAARLGPVTAVLHAAGVNQPALIGSLDRDLLMQTGRTKVDGLENLLAVLDRDALQLLVSFGSVIARCGLPGEAHYGLANEWLERVTSAHGEAHPHCRCLTLEWSAWSGVGMGARLGSIEALARQGISAIAPDQGVRLLLDILASDMSGPLILAGRIPDMPTYQLQRPALPVLRFLEHVPVHFPGIELIGDASISAATDPYVADHVFAGEPLFPAVMGLEAMAQGARAVTGSSGPFTFEQVEFMHPICVPEAQTVTVRVVCLVNTDGAVDVVLRSSTTGFAADHFRARVRCGSLRPQPSRVAIDAVDARPPQFSPTLYDTLLFHRGRFETVRGYDHLQPRACCFQVDVNAADPWFGRFLAPDLILGDPGARDGSIHGIQACIPHQRLLPMGVEEITAGALSGAGPLWVSAVERHQAESTYTYDLEIRTAEGVVCERWRGLRLRSVENIEHRTWQPALFANYLQRCLESLLPGAAIDAALRSHGSSRHEASAATLAALFGRNVKIARRADGRPELLDAACQVSTSHSLAMTLAVRSPGTVACDLQTVSDRTGEQWADLLGADHCQLLSSILLPPIAESDGAAATRVWSARECIRKTGAPFNSPLAVCARLEGGWVVFAAGTKRIATCVARLGDEGEFVFAILAGAADASV